MTAKARYGLAEGSGERSSRRVAFSLPGLYIGTRTMRRAVAAGPRDVDGSLVAGNQALVGVHERVGDGAELGRVLQQAGDVVLARSCERLKPSGSLASKNALPSLVNSDWCTCMPEPFWPKIGFGMNVAYTPFGSAISLTTRR